MGDPVTPFTARVADKRMRLTKLVLILPVSGLTSISTSVQIQAVGRIHYCESPHENWDGNVRELCNINLGIESGIQGGFCEGGVRFFWLVSPSGVIPSPPQTHNQNLAQ